MLYVEGISVELSTPFHITTQFITGALGAAKLNEAHKLESDERQAKSEAERKRLHEERMNLLEYGIFCLSFSCETILIQA